MSEYPEDIQTFVAFDKIPRLRRTVVVTEKIDGTNALVAVSESGVIRAGSRSRWITPSDDNAGFARWVEENKGELAKLGPGFHYGEWWGAGIQRRYGLTEKRFSLFNAGRWTDDVRPACCHVVPVLGTGTQDEVLEAPRSCEARSTVLSVHPGGIRRLLLTARRASPRIQGMERPSHVTPSSSKDVRPRSREDVRAEAQAALAGLQAAARASGASEMTDDEIDAEVVAARAERRARTPR